MSALKEVGQIMAVQPLTIRGGHIWNGQDVEQRDLYTSDVVLDKPASGALTVDLDGYTIFPGLINAHDHLELNHYPRSKFRERYDNAHQWGEDMNARLDTEPYKSLRAYPLWDRLFIGGLKNLLCGATTVAHHNPPHKELWRKDFPVRVLRNYGWAHSLHFNTDEEVVRSYRATPKDWPWFIHLAEGTDDIAAGEYQRLKALGCVGSNTFIVHGLGMTWEDDGDAKTAKARLVTCPTTNLYLLDKTLFFQSSFMRSRLLLGSDSRLTAQGDLLDELRVFYKLYSEYDSKVSPGGIYMTFTFGAEVELGVRSWRSNFWDSGSHNDFIAMRVDYESVMPAPILNARRTDLALVVFEGAPQIGDPDVMAKFPHIETVDATLDGVPKRIHLDLARRIHQCGLKEPGLEVDMLPTRKYQIFQRKDARNAKKNNGQGA